MGKYKPILKYTYSCQKCGNEINFNLPVEIIRNSYPLCSQKCKFRVVYDIISQYSDKELQYIQNLLSIPKLKDNNRKKLVYMITLQYVKKLNSDYKKEVTHTQILNE